MLGTPTLGRLGRLGTPTWRGRLGTWRGRLGTVTELLLSEGQQGTVAAADGAVLHVVVTRVGSALVLTVAKDVATAAAIGPVAGATSAPRRWATSRCSRRSLPTATRGRRTR